MPCNCNLQWTEALSSSPPRTRGVHTDDKPADEKNLALAEQGEVPLVVTVGNKVVLKVKDSKKFIKAAGLSVDEDQPEVPPKKTKTKQKLERVSYDDDSAEPTPTPTPKLDRTKPKKTSTALARPARPDALRPAPPHAGSSRVYPPLPPAFPPPPPAFPPYQPPYPQRQYPGNAYDYEDSRRDPYYAAPYGPDPRYRERYQPSYAYNPYPGYPPAPAPAPDFDIQSQYARLPPPPAHHPAQQSYPPSDYRSRDEPVGPSPRVPALKRKPVKEGQDDNPAKAKKARKQPDDLDRLPNGEFTEAAKQRLREVASRGLAEVTVKVRASHLGPFLELSGSIEACDPIYHTKADHKTWVYDTVDAGWSRLKTNQHFVPEEFYTEEYETFCEANDLFRNTFVPVLDTNATGIPILEHKCEGHSCLRPPRFTIRALCSLPSTMPASNLIDYLKSQERYDINLVRDGQPRKRLYCTLRQLELEREWHPKDPCQDCGLAVAPLGFGCYWVNDDEPRLGSYVFHKVCKACWPYSIFNDRFDPDLGTTNAPPCTCPPGSIACGDVPTDCVLHKNVTAMKPVPAGATHGFSPLLRHEQISLLHKLLDEAFVECETAPRNEREARHVKVTALLYHLGERLSNRDWVMPPQRQSLFVMPPQVKKIGPSAKSSPVNPGTSNASTSTTPAVATVSAAPPAEPLQRSFTGAIRRPPKIPPGHPYDYRSKR
ncbi:hypothetical protein C8F04DRAFT_1183737 [Mycena alexandri]|uniref:Uncharacterized protein n=1 Tax=Mycena alexandri TaxID=1745969 RepID=A0AAD6SUL2_9AGAR|nr:hypothetical protein C8F04DRAFT_1183737 [Mycena alexandri]